MTKNKRNISFNHIIGAALICLMLIGSFRYFGIKKTDRLFAEHYQSAQTSYTNLRGKVQNQNENLALALSLYGDKKFSAAAPLFSKYLSLNPDDFEATYLAGISFLETNQFEKAVRAFKIARINSKEYYEDASWYLALTYLRKSQVSQAKTILKELITSPLQNKKNKAKKLLSEIS